MSKLFAIADLHLAISTPQKDMGIYGARWYDYHDRLQKQWHATVSEEDLVLIPGDISWAMRMEDALIDLAWIDALPGRKVMIRGNHDYWWASLAKMEKVLPKSITAIHNTIYLWRDFAICGSRLWDDPQWCEIPHEEHKIFDRELQRLEIGLKQLPNDGVRKVVMLHYPPIPETMRATRTSALLEKYGVELCVFGHIHVENPPKFGVMGPVDYKLVAADALQFCPLLLY